MISWDPWHSQDKRRETRARLTIVRMGMPLTKRIYVQRIGLKEYILEKQL